VLFSLRVIQIYGKIEHITSKYIEIASDSSHDNERSQYDLVVVQVRCLLHTMLCTMCTLHCTVCCMLCLLYVLYHGLYESVGCY
jgi:hypothetical protein